MTLLATLSPEFQNRSRSKLAQLIAAASSGAAPAGLGHTVSASASPAPIVPEAVDEVQAFAPSLATIEDKVVRLEPRNRRSTLLKEAPSGGLADLESVEALENYSLEALKKLCRNESLDVSKTANRDAVLQILRQAFTNL